MVLLTEIQYLPPVDFFVRAFKHDQILIEANENYQKQSYRNRCYIMGANKIEELSVPVKKTGGKQGVREVEIDYDQKWLQVHWRTIEAAYGKSPYFEYFSHFFYAVYFKKPRFLFDLNYELLRVCFRLLGSDKEILFTNSYTEVTGGTANGIKDYREKIHPKKESQTEFDRYTQVFGKDFVSNLSFIDLLFCEGKNSLKVLQSCSIKDT